MFSNLTKPDVNRVNCILSNFSLGNTTTYYEMDFEKKVSVSSERLDKDFISFQ